MEAQLKKIAVLILNWNGRKLLERFLPSVIENNSSFAEIIIVDNNSSDDSINFLDTNYPSIKKIKLENNLGFAEGYNVAINKITHEYVVLLNSDVRVGKEWLIAPFNFLNKNHEYAVCQPKVLDEKNYKKFEYAGACGGYIDLFGYPFCRGRIFDTLEIDNSQYNTNRDVFWASGAALFIRRKLYIEAGGLDSSFFAHQEEIDLCWRIINNGYKIACIPESIVFHLGGASLNKVNPQKTFLNFRNNLIMLLKNLPTSHLPLILIRLILDGLAGIKFISEGKISHAFAILKGHFSFYLKIPRILIKRKNPKKIKANIQYKKSIIIDYYLLRKKYFKELNW